MLPFKYRQNKILSIMFRNVSSVNRCFFVEVEPLYHFETKESFKSSPTTLCIVKFIVIDILES